LDDYLSDLEIRIHLAAGRYYGQSTTCGTKVKWPTYAKANKEAERLNQLHKTDDNPAMHHPREAYPCFFCSPDRDNYVFYWHVGRMMSALEWSVFLEAADKILSMEDVTLTGGETLRVHNRKMCQGRHCSIHNPSNHHMVTWPQHWRSYAKRMERICPHGVGHPDPDDVIFRASKGDNHTAHGCDGCC
jgi:hypothetical protein